ncbi:Imm15 family immunity protein [Edaphovirga cremea]|uniref:Imm15 family immunity protein n=1 Tax=Edaphovirga cremea TaxID=2267246 RepID=UPI00398A0CED
MNDKFEKEFVTLMDKEGLNDMSIYFRDYETFEEIPLFSRYKNISFLRRFTFNEKNKILILKMVDVLRNVKEVSTHYLSSAELDDYFIGISITEWDYDEYKEINCLTPNLFLSKRKRWLLSSLELRQKNSIEENLLKEYLSSLGIMDFDVYVTTKKNDFNRLYILNKTIF